MNAVLYRVGDPLQLGAPALTRLVKTAATCRSELVVLHDPLPSWLVVLADELGCPLHTLASPAAAAAPAPGVPAQPPGRREVLSVAPDADVARGQALLRTQPGDAAGSRLLSRVTSREVAADCGLPVPDTVVWDPRQDPPPPALARLVQGRPGGVTVRPVHGRAARPRRLDSIADVHHVARTVSRQLGDAVSIEWLPVGTQCCLHVVRVDGRLLTVAWTVDAGTAAQAPYAGAAVLPAARPPAALVGDAERLLSAARFDGVARVTFVVDPDGTRWVADVEPYSSRGSALVWTSRGYCSLDVALQGALPLAEPAVPAVAVSLPADYVPLLARDPGVLEGGWVHPGAAGPYALLRCPAGAGQLRALSDRLSARLGVSVLPHARALEAAEALSPGG